ncbi:rRNA biogenesis protein rrp36-like isoform X2 [Diospyros lotus]|uniref:rRNA biogenesis protein rrp36-like isoform X2 n=1 Tax=Diospyros lotus TaxID=55363 RepID=UPI00224E619F|nr:rRNA biogenesis protein rrp36-like isoform X2 [Diospyros lotus]
MTMNLVIFLKMIRVISATEEDGDDGEEDDGEADDLETGSEDDSIQEDDEGAENEDSDNSTEMFNDLSDRDDISADNHESSDADNDDREEEDKDEESKALVDNHLGGKVSNAQKRKFSNFDGQLNAADTRLQALKRLAEAKRQHLASDKSDGILSNEDFQRIKELEAKKEARSALTHHRLLRKGSDANTAFKVPSSDQLSVKRVDPAKLEAQIKKKLSKEERLALVRAGREERGKYQARTALKQKKILLQCYIPKHWQR